jgi:hypothetical protein
VEFGIGQLLAMANSTAARCSALVFTGDMLVVGTRYSVCLILLSGGPSLGVGRGSPRPKVTVAIGSLIAESIAPTVQLRACPLLIFVSHEWHFTRR